VPVGLERIGPLWAHVVERQNSAHTADQWAHPMMRSAEIERLQAAADYCLLQLRVAPPRRGAINLLPQGYIEKSLQSCGSACSG
jgi:hypothetical protein